MYKKNLTKNKRKNIVVALALAFSLSFSGSYIEIPKVSESDIYAAGEEEVSGTGVGDAVTEEAEDNILKAKTGRIAFWEWKEITNVKTTFSDNKYHPIMFASVKTNSFGRHPFLSSYSNRDYVYLPTNTSRLNNYKDDFNSVKNNPETENSYYGYYGKKTNEAHSPSYYFNATESVYYLNTLTGKNGIPDADYNSKRFFTFGDSMGVPWLAAVNWGPDGGRTMMSICFPKKQLSNGEAGVWQPNDKDYYLDVRAYAEDEKNKNMEPTMVISHKKSRLEDNVPQDVWHLVYVGSIGSDSTKSSMWGLLAYNDSYRNDVCNDSFGSNIINGNTDYSFFTMFADYYYNIIPQGSKSPCIGRTGTHYIWKAYEGFPHLMTSLESMTVKAPEVMPIDAGVFIGAGDDENDNGTAEKSDGIVLPKGKTLTIDGGTVYVATNFLNNGRIKIKNGGTLIVKKGGCISPYTKNCEGEGTIECDGGNIIVMEGGKIYGFCNKGNSTSNYYNITNAPLRLVGGGTMINYGTSIFTFGVIGKGSKIENRKNGVLRFGYNRVDELEFMDRNPNNISLSDPANYPDNMRTIGVFGIGSFVKATDKSSVGFKTTEKATIYNEKTATFDHKGKGGLELAPSDRVDIIVPNY